jgi:hypothetical protein
VVVKLLTRIAFSGLSASANLVAIAASVVHEACIWSFLLSCMCTGMVKDVCL